MLRVGRTGRGRFTNRPYGWRRAGYAGVQDGGYETCWRCVVVGGSRTAPTDGGVQDTRGCRTGRQGMLALRGRGRFANRPYVGVYGIWINM